MQSLTARLLGAAAVVAACAVAFSPFARAEGISHSGYFKTPSGSVYCDYLYGSRIVAKYRYVRCGFRGNLKPKESRPKGGCPKGTDYVGNRMQLLEQGRGQIQPCAGNHGPLDDPTAAVVLPYGHTWHGATFSCTSSRAGMTCRSKSGHGFYLAKHGWRVF